MQCIVMYGMEWNGIWNGMYVTYVYISLIILCICVILHQ
jgi:hypothetical protein